MKWMTQIYWGFSQNDNNITKKGIVDSSKNILEQRMYANTHKYKREGPSIELGMKRRLWDEVGNGSG